MKIKTLLRGDVTTVRDDMPLLEARDLMARHGMRLVPVVRGGELVGILREAEVRRASASTVAALARHDWPRLLERVSVRDIMQPVTATVTPESTVEETAALMGALGVDGLPVVEHGAVAGAVTTGDLLTVLIGTLRHRGEARLDHILVVCDAGYEDEEVAAAALALSREHGARLTLLHPLDQLDRLVRHGAPAVLVARVQEVRARDAMARLRTLVTPEGEQAVDHRVVIGDPPSVIVRTASDIGADLIVMGRRSRDAADRSYDVEDVTGRAPCPVLVTSSQPRGARVMEGLTKEAA